MSYETGYWVKMKVPSRDDPEHIWEECWMWVDSNKSIRYTSEGEADEGDLLR